MAKSMKNVVEKKQDDNVIRVPKKFGGAGGGDPRINAHACVTRDRKKTANKRACRKRVRF
jgi:hypothetical protein